MSLLQIAAPDLKPLSIGGASIQLLDAPGFSGDGKTLLVRAIFLDDGDSSNALHYGVWIYDLLTHQYTACINNLLADSPGSASDLDITSAAIVGSGSEMTVVAQTVSRSSPDDVRLELVSNGVLVDSDFLSTAVGQEVHPRIERFSVSDDGRFVAVQTDSPMLAPDNDPDTNDTSDIYLIDRESMAVRRISYLGGSEVNYPVYLGNVYSNGSSVQVSFTTDAAFTSTTIDRNSAPGATDVPGARTDAYLWTSSYDSSGLTGSAIFRLLSVNSQGHASGYVESEAHVQATGSGVFFSSSAADLIPVDANASIDPFIATQSQNPGRIALNGISELVQGAAILGASTSGRYVALYSDSPELAGMGGVQQIIVVDREDGSWRVVSRNTIALADDMVISGVISPNGAAVAFTTAADNLDSNPLNAPYGLFVAVDNASAGSISITGSAVQGHVLTTEHTFSGVDAPGSISYQWFADGNAIPGATASTYTLTQLEVGKSVTVTATCTDNQGYHSVAGSSATDVVLNINDIPSGEVMIDGSAAEGETLTVVNTLADADGLGTIHYQWESSGSAISGATSSSYTLTHAEVGKVITVTASYQDSFGAAESVTSAGTGVVADTIAPTVSAFSPSDSATGVGLGSDILLAFSETIRRGSGTIELHSGSSTGPLIESYDVATDLSHLSVSGNLLTVNPAADLVGSTHYFLTFEAGTIKDINGNSYAGTSAYDFTTADSSFDLSGDIRFWKTGTGITGVSSILSTNPVAGGAQPIEFRNMQVGADGSRTIEIWETSTSTSIDDIQLELKLPEGSAASWLNSATLPSGWTSLINTETSGVFIIEVRGLIPLSAGAVRLGTLTLSSPAPASHLELQLISGILGDVDIPAFGIVSDTIVTGNAGSYQHTDLSSGSFTLSSTKAADSTVTNAIRSNDALAALKIAYGINPNADGSKVTPYQYLASDVNHDGRVNAADALNILKMAFRIFSAPANEWIFVQDSVGADAGMSRADVHWPADPVTLTLDHDQDVHLVGIVKGDVNGSWV